MKTLHESLSTLWKPTARAETGIKFSSLTVDVRCTGMQRVHRFKLCSWLRVSASILALAAWSCTKNSEIGHSHTYVGVGFTMVLRPEVLSNADSPGEDFRLYDFHVGSHPLLFAYAGNRPNHPHFSWSAPSIDTELESGLRGKCRSRRDPRGTGMSRECLFDLGHENPSRLHIWYENLDPKLMKTADLAIASIAPAEL